MKQGYEVFRNVSTYGSVDIVALKNDVVYKFDVKAVESIEKQIGKGSHLSPRQLALGIMALYVDVNDRCMIEEQAIPRKVKQFKCRHCGEAFTQLSRRLRDYRTTCVTCTPATPA